MTLTRLVFVVVPLAILLGVLFGLALRHFWPPGEK